MKDDLELKRRRAPGEKAADDDGILVRPRRTEGGQVRKGHRLKEQPDKVRRTGEGELSSSSAVLASFECFEPDVAGIPCQ